MADVNRERGHSFEARVLWVEWLSRTAFAIRLERPSGFLFLPGQSVRVDHDGVERDYSLASGPADDHVTLCVRLVPGGMLSPRLAGLRPGNLLRFTGPHGYFLLQSVSTRLVFVATGTGVAPFVSMVRSGASSFTLLHGVRTAQELYYREELSAAASLYVPCLSENSSMGCFAGLVTEWAGENLAPGTYDFYLCGNRSMIRDFTLLIDDRFSGSRICTEVFH